MKYIAFFSLFINALVWAECPPGQHGHEHTTSEYVCSPETEYVCESEFVVDPETGASSYETKCDYKTETKCEWVTETHIDCFPDSDPDHQHADPHKPQPEPYYPDPDPYYPPVVASPTPASLSTLKSGDTVVTLYPTYLQVGTSVIATVPRRTTLRVESIHESGWFWTTYSNVKGWVRIPHVYIKR